MSTQLCLKVRQLKQPVTLSTSLQYQMEGPSKLWGHLGAGIRSMEEIWMVFIDQHPGKVASLCILWGAVEQHKLQLNCRGCGPDCQAKKKKKKKTINGLLSSVVSAFQ